jgi:very-short-patch-repair endonuclease
MEAWLEPYMKSWGFERNKKMRCVSVQKQVDFINREKGIVIEVDGPWHFLPLHGEEVLKRVQKRDLLLEKEVLRRQSWTLIRLGMDNFKSSGELIGISLDNLSEMIKCKSPGIYKVGKLYD